MNLGVQILRIQQIPGELVQGRGFQKTGDFFFWGGFKTGFPCLALAVLELTL